MRQCCRDVSLVAFERAGLVGVSQEAKSQENEEAGLPPEFRLEVPEQENGQTDAEEVHQRGEASLRLGDDAQVGTWDATRPDVPVPRTLNRDTLEQDEQNGGSADDGEECDEGVCVLEEFTVCGRDET